MSGDDMHVIMYKVLAYLYDCMKKGVEPQESRIRPGGDVAGPIPESYWCEIMAQMADRGLVRGVSVTQLWVDDCPRISMNKPVVTFRGFEFMRENKMMRDAYTLLKIRQEKSGMPFI